MEERNWTRMRRLAPSALKDMQVQGFVPMPAQPKRPRAGKSGVGSNAGPICFAARFSPHPAPSIPSYYPARNRVDRSANATGL